MDMTLSLPCRSGDQREAPFSTNRMEITVDQSPIACMKIMELFHAINVEEAREVYEKKNVCQFVMDEWDRLEEHCSNDLPVTVSEKLIDGCFDLCFCCIDSSLSMKVINFP